MNRNQFIREVYNQYNDDSNNPFVGLATVNDLLNTMVEVLTDALIREGKLKIKDVLSISVNSSEGERQGYDVYRGQRFKYKPKKKITVRIGKSIRDKINDIPVDEC